jgi:hypothetical protein
MVARGEAALSAEELQGWLEWAGSKLLAMNLSSPLPKGPRVSWPAFAQDHRTAYGYTNERLRAGRVTGHEITLMDEILPLVGLVQDITVRRIVNARILVTPVGNRYVYTWSRIAFMLHSDRRRVARLYANGLSEIIRRLSSDKVDAIRKSFDRLSQ